MIEKEKDEETLSWLTAMKDFLNLDKWFLPEPKKDRTLANIGKQPKLIKKRRRLNEIAKVSRKMNRGK